MRTIILFATLFIAVGVAMVWHFSRPQLFNAEQLTPEDLLMENNQGELVLGGGPPMTTLPKQASPPPAKPKVQQDIAVPLEKPKKTAAIREAFYIVKNGDTLSEIAQAQYGSAAPRIVNAIAKQNNLSNPNALKIGMQLILPEIK